jgi:mannose-6-phosphate isomerase-like protein (cupin superfamily)
MSEKKNHHSTDTDQFKQDIIEEIRPWGKFRSFPHKRANSIKIITVNPGGILSLQYHHNRSEFWVVLDKGLEITVGDRVWEPEENEEIWIRPKIPHRMKCIGAKPARIMEIWIGDSDESDIVRLDDIYGRNRD